MNGPTLIYININIDPFTPAILLELKVIRQETSLLEQTLDRSSCYLRKEISKVTTYVIMYVLCI